MSKHLKKGKELYDDLKDRQEYNQSIHILPTCLKDKTFLGNKLLVRIFQHTESPLTPQGVLKPQYLERHSEEGRIKGKLDPNQFKWASRAMIVAVPPAAQSYMEEHWNKETTLTPGQVVDIEPSALDLRNQVAIDRSSPISDFIGFIKIHPSNIEFVYSQDTLSLEYETTPTSDDSNK